jgi:lipoate-protein ligase B
MLNRTWYVAELGRMPYSEAWQLQLRLVEERAAGESGRDLILMLEHPPVFTLGKRGGRENLRVPEAVLEAEGIPIVQVERGGFITYHGPGQLVVYPIVHLEKAGLKVVDMVAGLEEAMIRTCGASGIRAERNPLNRGVWVGAKKIGSIGIAVRRGVSFHGMALNVALDLTHFCWIHPCGLEGVGMTSMHIEAGGGVTVDEVRRTMAGSIESAFGIRLQPFDIFAESEHAT